MMAQEVQPLLLQTKLQFPASAQSSPGSAGLWGSKVAGPVSQTN